MAIPLYPFLSISPFKTRFVLNHMVSFLCKLLLKVLGISIKSTGNSTEVNAGTLIVCNHVSYLDILIIASRYPTCFVTSNEMKETPGLGLLCKLGGCVFVERRDRKNIDTEVAEIKVALQKGLSVMFFPEAKSTGGKEVIPFKRSLFHAAVTANCNVLPLCINYLSLNDQIINPANKDKIFWYGEMDFGPHFKNLCSESSIEVELSTLSEITVESVSKDSKMLRDKAFEVISNKYKKIN